MTGNRLEHGLDGVARFRLAATPTPLDDLSGLAAALDVPSVLTKRDDLTGLAFGGNKVRSLEYFIGDAVAKGCDVFIAGGGVAQSNHARLCAAAAVRARLEPVLVLRRGDEAGDRITGSRLVTEMLGAQVHWCDVDPQLNDRLATSVRMDEVADAYRSAGHRPYVLHSSVHPLGVLGYLRCAVELAGQLHKRGVHRATFVAASEGVVLTGLRLGAALLGEDWTVIGVGWRPLQPGVADRLVELADATCSLLGLDNPLGADDFLLLDHGGPAYGRPSEAAWDAIALCAQADALLLDPVYTGKGMAGLMHAVRHGLIVADSTPVFVHTGGLPALFARPEQVLDAFRIRQPDRGTDD